MIHLILLFNINRLFLSIWPFIVNAEVVVVVPVPKNELNTLQESEAKKNIIFNSIMNKLFQYWPGTYMCNPAFSPHIKGGAENANM